MKAFAQLFQALDATTAQSAKLAALVAYLRVAPPADAAWATYFLAGGKPRQMVPTKRLKALAQEAAGLPEWLFEESYQAVGDLAGIDGNKTIDRVNLVSRTDGALRHRMVNDDGRWYLD